MPDNSQMTLVSTGLASQSRPEICFFQDQSWSSLTTLGTVLQECGLAVWQPDSSNIQDQLAAHAGTLCLVIDLPGRAGIRLLELLRRLAITLPAILIADCGDVPAGEDLVQACVLDVLRRPLDKRELLHWIECVLVSQTAIKGLPSSPLLVVPPAARQPRAAFSLL